MLYEYGMTWFNMSINESNWNAIATILNALSTAGFNGVRLPMFPESERVQGENPELGSSGDAVGWKECNQYAINIAQRIVSARSDVDNFFGFKIYYAPAYDNKLYQETLDSDQYSKWVTKFLGKEYGAHFISPFSANNSVLEIDVLNEKSSMQDAATLFELDVLVKIKASDVYLKKFTKPLLIGPDRSTVQHTINVLESYGPSLSTEKRSVRGDYRSFVDLVGTQARYVDDSARSANYLTMTQGQTVGVWCTLCSQEWDRVINQPLIQASTNAEELRALRQTRVDYGFWARYMDNRGEA